jgi:DNA-binding MarR family transcriptional regulator
MEDAGLDRLLAQLLRVVNPAAAPEAGAGAGAAAGGEEQGERPVTEHTAPTEAGFPAVSASEARALIELLAARGIAQGQLAALLGLEKSTVSRLAAGLERKGWLRRGRDEQNQRFMRLYLTPEGRMIAARVWRAWQSRQARILGGLSAEERAGLATGLRGLVRGLAAEGLLEGAATGPDPGKQGTGPGQGTGPATADGPDRGKQEAGPGQRTAPATEDGTDLADADGTDHAHAAGTDQADAAGTDPADANGTGPAVASGTDRYTEAPSAR